MKAGRITTYASSGWGLANDSRAETRVNSAMVRPADSLGQRTSLKAWRPGRIAFSPTPTLTLTVPASSPSMNVVVIQAFGASS
jgi:hypothetical protein